MTEFHITEKKRKREQIYLRSIHEDDLIKVIDQHGREVAFLRDVTVRVAFDDVRTVSLTAIESESESVQFYGQGKTKRGECNAAKRREWNESKRRQQADKIKAEWKHKAGSQLLPRSPVKEWCLALLKQWWRSAAHVLDKGKRIAWRKGNQRGLSRNVGSDRKV